MNVTRKLSIHGLFAAATMLLIHAGVQQAQAAEVKVTCPPANQVSGYVREVPNARRLANGTPANFSGVVWAVQHKHYDNGVFPILAKATRFTGATVSNENTLICRYEGKPIDFVVKPQALFGKCKALKGFQKVGVNQQCTLATQDCIAVCG